MEHGLVVIVTEMLYLPSTFTACIYVLSGCHDAVGRLQDCCRGKNVQVGLFAWLVVSR